MPIVLDTGSNKNRGERIRREEAPGSSGRAYEKYNMGCKKDGEGRT